jgi:hypothetical protein
MTDPRERELDLLRLLETACRGARTNTVGVAWVLDALDAHRAARAEEPRLAAVANPIHEATELAKRSLPILLRAPDRRRGPDAHAAVAAEIARLRASIAAAARRWAEMHDNVAFLAFADAIEAGIFDATPGRSDHDAAD